MTRHHRIVGGGGVELHAVETGNPTGRPILFLHGISQCWLTWSRQMTSNLADDCRLIALDLRGHGLSARATGGYADSTAWGQDVEAVIRALSLDHPILCGWSYGPLVILDYIRQCGDDAVGGLHFVGGLTQLGTERATAALTPELLALIPGFFATDAEASVRALESLIRLFFVREPPAEDLFRILGYNMSVPPYVRQAMLSRSIDNDDLLPRIRKPVLVTHGAADAIVRPAVVEEHKARIPHAQIAIVPDAGHAVFWDDPATFNRQLGAFVDGL
jgi:pimeloyl-ACP methyl ester carboxylesterase